MTRFFWILGFVLTITVVLAQKIDHSFEEETHPTVPDYSQENYWSALPWKQDTPDQTPDKSLQDNQENALVDVFYVHPTSLMAKHGVWNADLSNEKLNKGVDNWPVKHQASVFNSSARVFAPRYRQANYESFMALENTSSQQALALAYQDVKTAFEYYLENWNEGRPFIIAGHSQGSFHAIQLVAEKIDTTALIDQMVAAYLVGMPVKENQYQNCQPCQSSEDNHCFVSWNTMKKGSYPKYYDTFFEGAICHNPLTWTTENIYAEKSLQNGGVGSKFNKVFKNRYGAQVHEGILWVDAVNIPSIPFTKLKKNWHVADYNLFYVNIRHNVEERVANFTNQTEKAKTWETSNSESEAK